MAQRIKIENGPAEVLLEECVIGSQVTPIAVHLEEETAPDSGVFADMDFTNKEFQCLVKLHPKEEDNGEAIAAFAIVPRTPLTSGWLDMYLDGTATEAMVEKTYQASLKVWPAGSPELGDTMIVFELPMKYRATR
jgi:hypothetical protein